MAGLRRVKVNWGRETYGAGTLKSFAVSLEEVVYVSKSIGIKSSTMAMAIIWG